MSNTHDRLADRILHRLEQVGRGRLHRSILLRDMAALGDSSRDVDRALELLILRGEVRRVGDFYNRVRAALPKRQAPVRGAGSEAAP